MTSKKKLALEDRLSALPDRILTHILSFLSTKEAVQTMLIRRFDTLWTDLPNLNLEDGDLVGFWQPIIEDVDDSLNHGFFKFARNILTLHRRPILEKFRVHILTMFNSHIQLENMGHEVDAWLAFALRKQVKYLEFGFWMVEPDEELYKLPYRDFVSNSLVELNFCFIDLNTLRRVQMGSLSVLKLQWLISLKNNVFREIIQGCPLLKELEVCDCYDMTEIISDNMEILKIDRSSDYGDLLTINCPKLSSFYYNGCVGCLENFTFPGNLLGISPLLEELVVDIVEWHSDSLQDLESRLGTHMLENHQPWASLRRVVIRDTSKNS